jgi:hypothetical protein
MLVPPLPVADFAAFQAFAEAAPAITLPDAARPWSFAVAVRVAVLIAGALGTSSIVAGTPESAELARWLSRLGTKKGRADSHRAMALAHTMGPPGVGNWNAFTPLWIRQLNAWGEAMLTAFYTARAAEAEAADPAPLPPAETASPPTGTPPEETAGAVLVARVPTLDEGIKELIDRQGLDPPRNGIAGNIRWAAFEERLRQVCKVAPKDTWVSLRTIQRHVRDFREKRNHTSEA